MTVYINGKAVQNSPFDTAPPAELQKRMDKAVHQARFRQQVVARGDTVEGISLHSYRRLMNMAEDLLLIANAQAEIGNHSDAASAARWLAHVAKTARARHAARIRPRTLASAVGSVGVLQ